MTTNTTPDTTHRSFAVITIKEVPTADARDYRHTYAHCGHEDSTCPRITKVCWEECQWGDTFAAYAASCEFWDGEEIHLAPIPCRDCCAL